MPEMCERRAGGAAGESSRRPVGGEAAAVSDAVAVDADPVDAGRAPRDASAAGGGPACCAVAGSEVSKRRNRHTKLAAL